MAGKVFGSNSIIYYQLYILNFTFYILHSLFILFLRSLCCSLRSLRETAGHSLVIQ